MNIPSVPPCQHQCLYVHLPYVLCMYLVLACSQPLVGSGRLVDRPCAAARVLVPQQSLLVNPRLSRTPAYIAGGAGVADIDADTIHAPHAHDTAVQIAVIAVVKRIKRWRGRPRPPPIIRPAGAALQGGYAHVCHVN